MLKKFYNILKQKFEKLNMEIENFKNKTNIQQFQLSADDACCGKVFITRKRELVMHCSFCQNNFGCFDDFVDHLATQHTLNNIYVEGSENEAEWKFPCSPFSDIQEQENDYAEFSHIQRFAEVVIKPDFKEVQEEYLEEIEEVVINNGTYCDEKPSVCMSSMIREHFDKEIEPDVKANMEHLILDDLDVDKILNNTGVDFDMQNIQDKENYNMDKIYRQSQFEEKEQLSTIFKFREENQMEDTSAEVFKCNICDKVFQYKHRLKKHRIIHSEERKYKCHLCDFAFKDNSNLRAHLTRHTKQKKFSCDICSKKFFTRSEAGQHRRFHTGERPYICTNCGLSFATSGALTAHAKRHNSEPTFKCNHCGKGFYGKSDFKDHMLVHTKEKPYVCHICAASFPRLKSMLRHTKLHARSS